ncbi:hypothetical protein AOC36_05790 [Erysipelothrix larvae]|uniref:Ribonuclease n=1 Tax=Erysipelothrix larvae TaxID=1514105 RepID=A0A109UH03_9FIRM|nr:ribonuclease HII [Erysipelothrix larvae]AMC93508.1 hypothetical protein AOC36_05790 [Erysipelothrix larvae]
MGLIHEFEKPLWDIGKTVVGIDEAGRGPMAGPCICCGVVFPMGFDDERINDSKKLTEKKREALVELIKSNCLWYHIEVVDVETIDTQNIYIATQQAMYKIACLAPCDTVLTDAMPLEGTNKHVIDIIKGDQKSISIAAASILAKTYRDQLMVEYASIYPMYGFEKHKGYGTKAHKEAILKYGRSPIHRKTFKFKEEIQISLDI